MDDPKGDANMQARHALVFAFSIYIVLAVAYIGWMVPHHSRLPFSVSITDAKSAVLEPISGIALPPGMQPGDRIDLPALDPEARIAVSIMSMEAYLPQGQTYVFVIERGGSEVTRPATTVDYSASRGLWFSQWTYVGFMALV